MTVLHRQGYLSIGGYLWRAADCRKLLNAFAEKNHLQFSESLSPRDYRTQMEQQLQKALHGMPQVGFTFKMKALEIIKKLNRWQDERILSSVHPEDLAFKYDPLIRYLVELKVGGTYVSKENVYQYVQDKILNRLGNRFYLERYKGGDFRYFLDQEIEYRILDAIRKEQKKKTLPMADLSNAASGLIHTDSLEDSFLFQQLQKKFSIYIKTLRNEDKQEFLLQLLVCHASQEHLPAILELFPYEVEAVSTFFERVDHLYLEQSKQEEYELIAWFLETIGRPKRPDTIRKSLEKHKKNIWKLLFRETEQREKSVEKDRNDVFEWLIDAFFKESL